MTDGSNTAGNTHTDLKSQKPLGLNSSFPMFIST